MKIDYKILWFDDQPKQVEHDYESIKTFLSEHGFNLVVEWRESATNEELDELTGQLQYYNKYDLIMFDYDMGENIDGSEIASKLRKSIYTEMLFYSGKTVDELRKILFDRKVDGVFVAGRTDIVEELQLLLEDSIKRYCDMSGIRGIVMDEVSKFDILMRKFCAMILEKTDQTLFDETKDKIIGRIRDRGEHLVASASKIECPKSALQDFKISEFNLVRHRLCALLKRMPNIDESLFEDEKGLAKIQQLRNRLAHVEASYLPDGKMRLADNYEDVFDFDRFREIRCELKEISDTFLEIESGLTQAEFE